MSTEEQVLKQIEYLKLKKVINLYAKHWNALIYKTYGWNKRGVLWDLPYYGTNLILHKNNVMHIEKNVSRMCLYIDAC